MKTNQKGLGALEALLILVIIGLIGGVGGYVWHDQNKGKDTPSSAANLQNKPLAETKRKSKDGFLVIKEWGVKIPVTKTGLTLFYELTDNSVAFSSTELDDLCDGSYGPWTYNIARGLAEEFVPSETATSEEAKQLSDAERTTFGEFYKSPANLPSGPFAKKIGNYYYVHSVHFLVSCAKYDSGQEKLDKIENAQKLVVQMVQQMTQL